MLNSIIGFSIRNKLIVSLGVLLLVAMGIYQLRKLPIDALPDITSNQVQVITISPALAAPEVERLITFNIEQGCANIPGITELRSISRFGLSVVTIVFNDKTDVYWARQQVMERMVQVRELIPTSAGNPELAPLTTGLGEVYQYFLRTKPGYEEKYSLSELRSMQDWIVRRQLMGTPGVADVSSFGGHLLQYEVVVDPQRLNGMRVTMQDVFMALEANNENSGGGYIEKGPTSQFIRTEGLALNISDIEQMVVKQTPSGLPVLVRDVATVRKGTAIRYGALVYEDKGEVAGAVVLMLKGANANGVVQDVKDRIAAIQPSLPEGVEIIPFYDRTKVVNRALNTVTLNLTEGALIVIFILVIFLGNLRAGLIVASVIPLAMLFAISLMNLFGVSGNLMSLGALDFGLIVDGAVIIVEAVLHRLQLRTKEAGSNHLTQSQMDSEVKGASSKMMNAAVFGQVIILIVYLPILTLQGIEGKMFAPMAQTVAFALLGAFLLSLTYVPAATALLLNKKWKTSRTLSDRFIDKLRNVYQPLLKGALRRSGLVIGVAVVLFAFSLWILSRLGGAFIPELEEGDFAVDTRLLAGTSLTHTVEVAGKVAGALKKEFPEIEQIVTRVGASEIPTDPMPMEMSDVIILLKPKSEWTSATSYDDLADKMSEVLEDFPGLTAGFQFPIQMRFNELISGARQDVVCKLYGEDLDTLSKYAAKLAAIMPGIEGITDLYVETVTGLPQIQVVFNRTALARYGVSVQQANRVVQASFAGASTGLIYENERRYDLVVRLDEKGRGNIDDIKQLLIATNNATQVPLYLLADVSIEEGLNQIQREDARRRIIVSFNIRNRDVESVVQEVQQKVSQQVSFPPGYYLSFGGAFQNLQEAKERLSLAVPVSLLLIFFLLFLAFRTIGPGLIIFTAIPMSAIGGIIALWIRGMPFSISAGIGFIALFGVSVLNGIVLLTEIRRLYLDQGKEVYEAIVEGCVSRLRPVLMTAAVASFGFLPMALSERAGAEVQRPLATVVIAGLISSTILTLFVLPVLYQWMEKRKKRATPKMAMLWLLMLPIAAIAQPATVASKQVNKASLEDALQFVQQNHPQVAAQLLNENYRAALKGTARTLPKTGTELEAGQNEGPNFDFRISAFQAFQPIGLPGRQASLLDAQYTQSKVQTELTRKAVARNLRILYNQYFTQQTLLRVYQEMDSLLEKTIGLSKRRLALGETDRLELANLELLNGQISQQVQVTLMHLKALRQQLGILMLQQTEVEPTGTWALNEVVPLLKDTAALQQHPLVQLREKEAEAARLATEVEKAQNNPEWLVGLNSISVTGWQTSKDGLTERYYNAGNRFVSATVGLNFPLFAKGQKARVAAANIQAKVADKEVEVQQQQLSMEYTLLLGEWLGLRDQHTWYQQQAIPLSQSLIETANKRYLSGSINYLELNMAMQQALQTKLTAVDVQSKLGAKLIDLQYYYE